MYVCIKLYLDVWLVFEYDLIVVLWGMYVMIVDVFLVVVVN